MQTVRYLNTEPLSIAYEEYGPPDGAPVVLVHGFPDDASSWRPVAEALASEGLRVIAPFLRGVGPTRFREASRSRSGQLGALVGDLVDVLDGLELPTATLAGQDWGARVVQGVAALHPDRVEHVVSLGSYGLTWADGDGFPPPPVLHALWYQYVLMLDLGEALLRVDPTPFCRYLWDTWSPTWASRGQAFDAVSGSLQNPNFADVVLSAYRHGRGAATTDPVYDHIDAALDAGPRIEVPSIVLLGADDGVEQPSAEDTRDATFFSRLLERRILPDVGHFVHREAPGTVAAAILAGAR